ncbi:MAG TPA: hypothetical protein VGD76_03460 [Ramlibacter sp.]
MNGWRTTWLFAATFVVGSAALLAAYLGGFGSLPAQQSPPAGTVNAAAPDTRLAAAQPAAAPAVVSAPATCPSQALAPMGADGDGQFMLQAALSASAQTDPSAFVTVAREAAAEGHMRDAEVALMAACHLAERSAGAQSAPVAELKSQMGQHYVLLAAREPAEEARESLLQRASGLFSESAQAFAAALGRNASRTRMAEQRLASVRAPSTLRAAAREQAGRGTATMGAASSRPADLDARAPARGLIRSDPELSQLEADLQRLRNQAARVTRDPRGMQQRDAWAQSQRDSRCRDRACLLQWYAQRRAQLLDEF